MPEGLALHHSLRLSLRLFQGPRDLGQVVHLFSQSCLRTVRSKSWLPVPPGNWLRLTCPFWHLVGRLRGSQGSWTPSARIARAFAAGLAAKKRLEGIVHPHAAPGTPCRNSIYIALRAPFRPEGFWTPNYPTYIRLVEPRDFDSGSVSHAFATRAEADAYLLGAARAWPPAL